MKLHFASLAVALAVVAPGVSHAADGLRTDGSSIQVRIGPSGVAFGYGADQRYDSWRRYNHGGWINRYEAVRIAQRYGLSRVTDLDFDDGYWEVEGVTHRGARIDVEISARTGRVVDVDYGWRGHGRRFRGHDHGRHRGHDGWRASTYGWGGHWNRDWDRRDDRDRGHDHDRRDRDHDRRGERDHRRGH